jgi:hypothetical protein
MDVHLTLKRVEAEFLHKAPQDAPEISRFAAAVGRLGSFGLREYSELWPTLVRSNQPQTSLGRMQPTSATFWYHVKYDENPA